MKRSLECDSENEPRKKQMSDNTIEPHFTSSSHQTTILRDDLVECDSENEPRKKQMSDNTIEPHFTSSSHQTTILRDDLVRMMAVFSKEQSHGQDAVDALETMSVHFLNRLIEKVVLKSGKNPKKLNEQDLLFVLRRNSRFYKKAADLLHFNRIWLQISEKFYGINDQ